MKTPATETAIGILMASNMEDVAYDLTNEVAELKLELERVKRIAFHRLQLASQRLAHIQKLDPELAEMLAMDTVPPEDESIAARRAIPRDQEREEITRLKLENERLRTQIEDDAIERAADAPLGMGLWGSFCRGEMD